MSSFNFDALHDALIIKVGYLAAENNDLRAELTDTKAHAEKLANRVQELSKANAELTDHNREAEGLIDRMRSNDRFHLPEDEAAVLSRYRNLKPGETMAMNKPLKIVSM